MWHENPGNPQDSHHSDFLRNHVVNLDSMHISKFVIDFWPNNFILSYIIFYHIFILSYIIIFYHMLSYIIIYYHILSYIIIFYHIVIVSYILVYIYYGKSSFWVGQFMGKSSYWFLSARGGAFEASFDPRATPSAKGQRVPARHRSPKPHPRSRHRRPGDANGFVGFMVNSLTFYMANYHLVI